jgi:hypothetical protein
MGKPNRTKRDSKEDLSLEEMQRDLEDFSKSAALLSTRHAELVEQYPTQWVGAYKGRVVATASTLPLLLAQLDVSGIPRGNTAVQFISRDEPVMILHLE